MKTDEFYAKVRDRGNYENVAEAERVTNTVLGLLGRRLAGGEAKDLAAQLPPEVQQPLLAVQAEPSEGRAGGASGGEGFGVEEFLSRAASELDATAETAKWDASAVLTTVAEAITGGELNQVLTQLQPAYAELFGKPELA